MIYDSFIFHCSKSSMHNCFSSLASFHRVGSEGNNFRLLTSGFSGNVSYDALTSTHHGEPFSTYDKDLDSIEGNCASNNGGGWWYNKCHRAVLTATFPTTTDRNSRTIRWYRPDGWLVLDDVTMKIRPTHYGQRFNIYADGEWLMNYYRVKGHKRHPTFKIHEFIIHNV